MKFFIHSFDVVSELVEGGELFDRIHKFTYKLVQLYVAEIAVALGNYFMLTTVMHNSVTCAHGQFYEFSRPKLN